LLRCRSNKYDAGLLTGGGKRQAFREKTVARPDSLGAAFLRGRQNFINAQIAVAGFVTAQTNSDIGIFDMLRVTVGIGKTATLVMPKRFRVRIARQAISPRLAIRTVLNMID
jgi:hypothetical protein